MSCDFIEAPEQVQGSTLTQLLSDPLSKEFSLALYKTREINALFIGDQPINDAALKKEFASIEDLKIFISENYKNPDYVFNTMYEVAAIGQKIREMYPDVSNFTQSDLERLVVQGVQSGNMSLDLNSSSDAGVQGHCEEELNSRKQTCGYTALVTAARCAILTSTLEGALICDGFVYLVERTCFEDASKSFEICNKD
jgi:hypothetical protein